MFHDIYCSGIRIRLFWGAIHKPYLIQAYALFCQSAQHVCVQAALASTKEPPDTLARQAAREYNTWPGHWISPCGLLSSENYFYFRNWLQLLWSSYLVGSNIWEFVCPRSSQMVLSSFEFFLSFCLRFTGYDSSILRSHSKFSKFPLRVHNV